MMTTPQQAWVDALRSGQYKQASYRLKDAATDGFCCLGVLCEISRKGHFDNRNRYVCDPSYKDQNEYSAQWVPKAVQDWVGLKSSIGAIDGASSLAGLNDAEGLTFKQIADIIEKQAEELFQRPESAIRC